MLRATTSFVVVPSLGALVPGWVLVIPRRPMVSLREMTRNEREELVSLIASTQTEMSVFGSPVYAFEHGSGRHGSQTGCGLDHAHLHLVPLVFDLVELATSQADEITWKHVPHLPMVELPTAGEYVTVWKAENGAGAIGTLHKPVSQWMRRVIAHELGAEAQWDYRTNPQTANIRTTVNALRPAARLMTSAG